MKWLPIGEIIFVMGLGALIDGCQYLLLGWPARNDLLWGIVLTIVGWRIWRHTVP